MNEERLQEYELKKKLFVNEQHDFEFNQICERKFVQFSREGDTDLPVLHNNQSSFDNQSIHSYLILTLLQHNMSALRNNKLKSFVKL